METLRTVAAYALTAINACIWVYVLILASGSL
jgi:hypothetical protein